MDISSALKVLRDATPEALWQHRQEIEVTLVNIGKRLESATLATNRSDESIVCLPDILGQSSSDELSERQSHADYRIVLPEQERRRLEGSEQETMSGDHSSTDSEISQSSSHIRSRSGAKDWPAKLMTAFADDLPWLCTFLRRDPTMILDERKRDRKDERIRDIQLVEGNDHPGREDRIFRGLAQRSMALQFTRLQQKANKGQTRVDELCDSICSTDPKIRARIHRRTNFITKYLQHFAFSPEDKDLVLRSINAGVKQLVVEKLFEKRLEQRGRPSTACAISAITALNFFPFKSLRFEDIPRFIDLIFLESSNVQVYLDSTATGPAQVGTFQIADILAVMSSTFSDLQRHYNVSRCSMKEQDLEPPRPEFFPTVLPQTPVHETSVNLHPTAPSGRPTKRRRLNVSAVSPASYQDHTSMDTQSAESGFIQHGGNQFGETVSRLPSNDPDSSIFSRGTFPTAGYCDVTQVVNYDQAGCGFNDINQLLGEGLYFNGYPLRRYPDPDGYEFCDVTHAVQDYNSQNTSFVNSVIAYS
ncbi:hypothetical protein KXV25_003706 [Aspergillus fumigatus]|nr:hypothetical protein KXW63_001460 [Aspergillus fumigatus]KAH2979749.1 hypothetical protein KXV25_003706 [Aspergillus fumigatus]KAH3504783.1 hypothetical protein KXW24_007719 [Aspergillus fumigatus]